MLLNSLLLLLLSNAFTSRRDKSILYSRATITILLISAFIAYDNLSLLFLAKGIGIFGGLFHTIATRNFFHLFIFLITSVIFLITSVILLLTSFYRDIFFTWPGLGLTKYISEPMLSLIVNGELKTSGFYTGKGKGKAIDLSEEEKPESPPKSETDSEYEEDTRKAIALSLQEKKGESSKRSWSKEDSPVGFDMDKLAIYIQDWKTSKDSFLAYAKLYNNLKIKLDKETVKSEKDLTLLSEYLKQSNKFKLLKDKMEKNLIEKGINPSEQFNLEDRSDTESYSSFYSSDKSQSSNNSQSRSKKRIKYSDVDNNLNFPLGFIGFNLIPVVRILSFIVSTILVLIIHLNILPILDMWFYIDLRLFFTLFLMVNLAKLMYKWYNTAINIYNHYLNKDYLTIYFNIYFSIVTVLLYFSSNSDICIFYC